LVTLTDLKRFALFAIAIVEFLVIIGPVVQLE